MMFDSLKEKAVAQRKAFDANREALQQKALKAFLNNQRVIAGHWLLPQGTSAILTMEPDGSLALFTGDAHGDPVLCEKFPTYEEDAQ